MAAWNDFNTWNSNTYNGYMRYVSTEAPRYKGSTEDCADLSIKLLIDYAETNRLPVSFWSMFDVLYSSRASHQWPEYWPPNSFALSWSDKRTFYSAIKRRINSVCLLEKNTFPIKNSADVWPGDLMLKEDHTAIVFAVYPPGTPHPFLQRADIPDFPTPERAASQLNVLEYFRTARTTTNNLRSIPPSEMNKVHVDYLNHRGEGSPKKQKAELIYFADADDMVNTYKLDYRRLGPKTVLNNWNGWKGNDAPPR